VTEPAAASHGYPGLCDINGKKLADGEFRQWVENNRLHVAITYKFSAGEVYEEHSQFRQEPELIQEKWSWKESKHGRSQREFAVDFLAGIARAHISQDHKDVSKRIKIEPGRTFAGFGFSLALSNLRKRLLRGEQVQLKAVGFSDFPTLGPQVVTVTISHRKLEAGELFASPIMARLPSPIIASPTRTTVFSGRRSSVISSYGFVTRITSTTLGRFSKRRSYEPRGQCFLH
jgi:hypothetical protein